MNHIEPILRTSLEMSLVVNEKRDLEKNKIDPKIDATKIIPKKRNGTRQYIPKLKLTFFAICLITSFVDAIHLTDGI